MPQEQLYLDQKTSYIPSAWEKKRVLLLYILLGIMFIVTKKSVTSYELYHIYQSIGWWIVFIVSLLASVILLFLPYLYILASIPIIILVSVWVYFVRQARVWYFETVIQTRALWVFAGLGQWLLMIFDVQFEVAGSLEVVVPGVSVSWEVAPVQQSPASQTTTLDTLGQESK